MNKKQWYALGFLFILYANAFIFIETKYTGYIEIVHGIATILAYVSFMASLTCWIMGWLE